MDEPESLYKDILVELKCPICTNFMTPPIIQCSSGHCICKSCTTKLPKCSLCQSKFTDVRNNFLENMARKIRYPCINKYLGCDAKLKVDEREIHEENCSFRTIKCAMVTCSWSGKLQDVSKHWDLKKMKSKAYQASNVCQTKIKYYLFYANILKAHNQLFWFKCKLERGKIYWAVQFLGNANKAAKYFYEIEIFNPDHPKQKILFSDYCQSVDLEDRYLLKEGVCITASTDCMKHFVDRDKVLNYNMRVAEDQETWNDQIEKEELSSKSYADTKSNDLCNSEPLLSSKSKQDFRRSFSNIMFK